MKTKVKLFATLREGRGKEVIVEMGVHVTPRRIIDFLGIDEEDAAILLVNGRDGSLDQELSEEDYLSIFPPVGGG